MSEPAVGGGADVVAWPRTSGVLLHVTSLSGGCGCGDLGPSATAFASFLKNAGQTWWQTLPISPPGKGFSPYAARSSFAGGEHLISLELLTHDGFLRQNEIEPIQTEPHQGVNEQALHIKRSLVQLAASRFHDKAPAHTIDQFSVFCDKNALWLDDWALYQAITHTQGNADWTRWPKAIRLRQPEALRDATSALQKQIERERLIQFFFHLQWRDLRAHGANAGVRLMGDVPFYPALFSADVWANQSLFDLGADGRPTAVAGVPPDYFSPTGQIWESPLYRWPEHERTSFDWWSARLARAGELFDAVRLDHFLGLHRAWRVPAEAPTAEHGAWTPAPGKALLQTVSQRSPTLRLVAEDLGVITPEAITLRDEAHLPSMRVLQLAFDGRPDNPNLPANHVENGVVYTGTHDNNTTRGWIESLHKTADTRAALRQACAVLGADESALLDSMIEAAQTSPAHTSIIPVQDWLGLGAEARMNTPGVADGNWRWRLNADVDLESYSDRMRQSARRSQRR